MPTAIEQAGSQFTITRHPRALVVSITEVHLRCDIDAEIMRYELLELIDETTPRLVIIDFSKVRFFSSAMISTLILVRQRLLEQQRLLAVSGMCVPMREVMNVMRLDDLIDSHETVDDALAVHG